jgi:hypothetical protein
MLHKLDNPLECCELKFDGVRDGQFEAYASVFNGVDAFKDTILPGAFEKTLTDRKKPVRMFWQHDPSTVIGKWLELREDETGLHVRGEFTPGNTNAENAHASMKHGAIDSLSIGFRIPQGGAIDKAKECDCNETDWCMHQTGRDIKEIDLIEISPVSLPADLQASVSVVKMEQITSLKDAELVLRDSAMFSRKEATSFVSQLKKMCRCDTEADLKQRITELERQLFGYKSKSELANMLDKYNLSDLINN